MTRNTDPTAGSDVTCRACGATFKAGIFCFYRLCDVCFPKFDEQKTQSRLAILRGQPATGTESVVEWLAMRKAVLSAWTNVQVNFLKALQALIDADIACAEAGVEPTQPLAPPELLEICKRSLQDRVERLPQYSDRTVEVAPTAPDKRA